MDNLLKRYGIEASPNKPFSISFIDDFLDCSHRTFLRRFVKVKSDVVNHNTLFGSGDHAGLAIVNELMRQGCPPCPSCEKNCKLETAHKKYAIDVPIEECKVKQLLMQGFNGQVTAEKKEAIKKQFSEKGKADQGLEIVAAMERLALPTMSEALFLKQPPGKVLMSETRMTTEICGFTMNGVVDLYMQIGSRGLICDYKSRSDYPTNESFPMRQFSVYAKMIRDLNLPVNALGTIYLIKKDPPKRKTKNSRAVHEYAVAHYLNLDECKDEFDANLQALSEDMSGIRKSIENGLFTRNRSSIFCSTCDVKEFCEKPSLVDVYLSNVRREQNKETQAK